MRSIARAVGVVICAQFLSSAVTAGPAIELAVDQAASSDAKRATRIIGRCGPYDAIDGTATIVRVGETAASAAQAGVSGGPGYAGYEVWFSFTANGPVSDTDAAAWIAKEHELRLANSWYPGPQFVKKYGLEAGETIPAVLQVQKGGPCSPFVFKFPTVDTTDYFESSQ